MTTKNPRYLRNVSVSSNVVELSFTYHINLKCRLKKPTYADVIEAKEVYIQLYFERYKGK